MFLTCPILETNKRLIHRSGLNMHDGISFQASLTTEQVLALRGEIEDLIKELHIDEAEVLQK